MSLFLSTNEFKVIKDEDDLYSIEFKQQSRDLIYSLTKSRIISGSTITDNYKTLTFKALSIESLPQFQKRINETYHSSTISHESALRMVLFLSTQLNYLLKNTLKCFFKYEKEKILVIDEEIFVYLSNEELVDREKETVIINLPFSHNGFLSPELLKINYIPAKINFKTIYYSLGLLVVYCLTEVNLLEHEIENLIEEEEPLKEILNELLKPIIGTKLYYFLVRSLDKEPKNRSLNYI
jgi:hypothetical protein